MDDSALTIEHVHRAIRRFKKYTGNYPKEFRTTMDSFIFMLNDAVERGKDDHIRLQADGSYTIYGVPVIFDESLMPGVHSYID